MKDGRISAIQVLRGLAVLGVVMFHCTVIQQKYAVGTLQLPGFLQIGQSGVDLFFVISGFVMIIVTHGRFGSRAQMSRFLYRRVTRIYPTYWFYCLLTLVVFLLKPAWVNASQGHQVDLWSSFLLLPDKVRPIVLVAWSLIHEMWFYMVFSILLLFREDKVLPALIVWGLAIAGINMAADVETFSPALRLVCHAHTMEFIIGSLAAILLRSGWTQRIRSGVLLALLAAVFLGLVAAHQFHAISYLGLTRALVFGVLYAVLLGSCVLLEPRHSFITPRSLRFVGDVSYSVYLCHVLVLSAIGRLFAAVKPHSNGIVDDLVVWPLMVGAVILFGWVSYRLVERPLLELSRSLGDRSLNAGSKIRTSKAQESTIAGALQTSSRQPL